MTIRNILSCSSVRRSAFAVSLAAGLIAGCKSSQPVVHTDPQISSDIHAQIQSESALADQNIQVTVANGVATLSGSVTDEASRALAGNDSGNIAGVKTVVNNLVVQPVPAQVTQEKAAPKPAPAPPPPARKASSRPQLALNDEPARPAYSAPQPTQQIAIAPAPVQQAAPPAPLRPVVKTVTLPAGTLLPVRLTEDLSSKTNVSNDEFHGSLASDIGVQGVIAIPSGSPIVGRIIEARNAARIQGSAMLNLELTQVTTRGQKITLVTDAYSKEGAGRGKNTAVKAGGGAVLGAIIGGLAGGGKGAAIGGLAGGAAGTGVNAATRGQQVEIPSETLVQFHLQSPVTLTVTIPPAGSENDSSNEPTLKTH